MYYGKNAFSLLLRYTLAHEIEEWGWEIGDHTYGAKGSPIIIEAEYAGLRIGKYCSIAREVLMILGNHRTDTITTYPFKRTSAISGRKQLTHPMTIPPRGISSSAMMSGSVRGPTSCRA